MNGPGPISPELGSHAQEVAGLNHAQVLNYGNTLVLRAAELPSKTLALLQDHTHSEAGRVLQDWTRSIARDASWWRSLTRWIPALGPRVSRAQLEQLKADLFRIHRETMALTSQANDCANALNRAAQVLEHAQAHFRAGDEQWQVTASSRQLSLLASAGQLQLTLMQLSALEELSLLQFRQVTQALQVVPAAGSPQQS